ncbi:MAG: HDOD domain-containing protein [Pseudomonadales bacterium]
MQTFYLARQPIYDSGLRVAGYELLFRDGDCGRAEFVDGDRATSEVVSSGVIDIGLSNLVGAHPAFINTSRRFLDGDLPLPDHRQQIVLEVLEDVRVDSALIARLEALSQAGYRIALDDFVYGPDSDALLAVADYVKLDVQALSAAQLADHVARVRAHSSRLIAEKVETYDMLAACRELGFDLYQGFFFCRPRVISGTRPETNRLAVLQLITRLQDPEAGIEELERLVSCDPALCYRLLKYINSAYCGVRAEVTSIRQALIMVGTSRLRGWATLLLMSRLSDGKPSELITTALIRARFCELLGGDDGAHDANQYFTVGLLSVLDALLDVPMSAVVDELPLDAEVCRALSGHAGPLGKTLARVIDYERGPGGMRQIGVGAGDVYVQALGWATETQHALVA